MTANRSNPGEDTGEMDAGKLVVPVMREELHVGKHTVDTGRGVRIHKTVSEQSHTIAEELLRDAVEVRRVAVDRIVSPSEAPVTRQEGDTLIVPVLEEVLIVEKRLRIKEEIHITRTHSPQRHDETVTLREEQVAIERFDEGPEHQVNSTTRR